MHPRQLLTSFHALSNVVGTNLQVASSQKKMSSRKRCQKNVWLTHQWGKERRKFGRLVTLSITRIVSLWRNVFQNTEDKTWRSCQKTPKKVCEHLHSFCFTHQATSKERGSIGLQGTSWKQPWKVLRKRWEGGKWHGHLTLHYLSGPSQGFTASHHQRSVCQDFFWCIFFWSELGGCWVSRLLRL